MPESVFRSIGMSKNEGRRLGIGDGLILIAAFTLAMSHLKFCLTGIGTFEVSLAPSVPWHDRIRFLLGASSSVCSCFPVVFSPVHLMLRVRQPRPRWPRLLREYETVGCLAATCLLPLSMSPASAAGFTPRDFEKLKSVKFWLIGIPIHAPERSGVAVIGAWLTLAVGRSGRRGDSVELLGRMIGLGWCCSYLANTYVNYTMKLY